jgi:hypothetical protein
MERGWLHISFCRQVSKGKCVAVEKTGELEPSEAKVIRESQEGLLCRFSDFTYLLKVPSDLDASLGIGGSPITFRLKKPSVSTGSLFDLYPLFCQSCHIGWKIVVPPITVRYSFNHLAVSRSSFIIADPTVVSLKKMGRPVITAHQKDIITWEIPDLAAVLVVVPSNKKYV